MADLDPQNGPAIGWDIVAARHQALLGGEAIDDAIVSHLALAFQKQHGIDLTRDHLALQRLHEAAEGAKLDLASNFSSGISLPFISATADGVACTDP